MAVLWLDIDLIGLVSSFLAVIDPNSFGLVHVENAMVKIGKIGKSNKNIRGKF